MTDGAQQVIYMCTIYIGRVIHGFSDPCRHCDGLWNYTPTLHVSLLHVTQVTKS